jgi:hypothetical protein
LRKKRLKEGGKMKAIKKIIDYMDTHGIKQQNDDICPLCLNTGEYHYGGSFGEKNVIVERE